MRVLTSTTLAKIGKTAINPVHISYNVLHDLRHVTNCHVAAKTTAGRVLF